MPHSGSAYAAVQRHPIDNLAASTCENNIHLYIYSSVLQLASLSWDRTFRARYANITGKSFEGFWDMVPCPFNPAYRQLAPNYPKSLSLIGSGAMGQVT